MPANIEIKARARDFAGQERLAESLAGGPPEILEQEDTFFRTRRGRLKLRLLGPGRGELIFYERADDTGPRRSQYRVIPTRDPAGLQAALAGALGVVGVVRKRRKVFLCGQTRIHLDEVEGLGRFLELEVVLRPGQTDTEGQAVTASIMEQLEVRREDLVAGAYLDLQLAGEKRDQYSVVWGLGETRRGCGHGNLNVM